MGAISRACLTWKKLPEGKEMAEKSAEGPQASRATVVQHPSGPSSWDFAVPGGSSPGLASGDMAFPRERERQQGQRVWVRSGQWGQMGPHPQVPHGSKSASQAVRAVSSLLTSGWSC